MLSVVIRSLRDLIQAVPACRLFVSIGVRSSRTPPCGQGTAGSPAQPRNTAPKGVSPTSVTAAPRCEAGRSPAPLVWISALHGPPSSPRREAGFQERTPLRGPSRTPARFWDNTKNGQHREEEL